MLFSDESLPILPNHAAWSNWVQSSLKETEEEISRLKPNDSVLGTVKAANGTRVDTTGNELRGGERPPELHRSGEPPLQNATSTKRKQGTVGAGTPVGLVGPATTGSACGFGGGFGGVGGQVPRPRAVEPLPGALPDNPGWSASAVAVERVMQANNPTRFAQPLVQRKSPRSAAGPAPERRALSSDRAADHGRPAPAPERRPLSGSADPAMVASSEPGGLTSSDDSLPRMQPAHGSRVARGWLPCSRGCGGI